MNKHIILIEYDFLQCKYENQRNYIEEKTFEELEVFILENKENNNLEFLKITTKRNYGIVIQAQNYVGLIKTKNNVEIEILPKITLLNNEKLKREKEVEKSKKILFKMLKKLKNSPFKSIKNSTMNSSKLPLFEIFILMFLGEVEKIVKRGIKSEYLLKSENLKFLKGRLNLKEQIQKNFIHKERFFVEYSEFSKNRVENKLIKTTLKYLYKKSKLNRNKKRIREYLFIFDEVGESKNIKNDFKNIKLDRQLKHYEQALVFSEVFLANKSFTPYKGDKVSLALLFDMNKLFENYVGSYLKENYKDYNVKEQDMKHHLAYDKNRGKFRLKPDFVIEKENKVIVADSKWKILDNKNYKNINQSDMYQLYAYGTKYENCEKLYLVYPYNKNFEEKEYSFFREEENKKLDIKIIYFDVEKYEMKEEI